MLVKQQKQRRVYVQGDPGNAHGRRIIEAAAAFGLQQMLPWHVRWGSKLDLVDLLKEGIDGIILFWQPMEVGRILEQTKLPIVQVGSGRSPAGFSTVCPNHREIGKLAVEHFRERLFRNFAFAGVPSLPYSAVRKMGFHSALKRGESFHHLDLSGGDQEQKEPFMAWLQSLPNQTGILAADDFVARRICQFCSEIGRRIPEDFAVLGVDNDELIILSSPVPFSSIDPGSSEIGYRAGSLLRDLMEGVQTDPVHWQVKPTGVVLRSSTDHLATDDNKVSQAAQLIRQEACLGLRVEDICQRIGLGRRMFEIRFQRVLGRTPEAEMRRIRMDRACQLLLVTNKPVKQVALEAGFQDSYYFSAAFKKAKGLSPRKWREEQLRTNNLSPNCA